MFNKVSGADPLSDRTCNLCDLTLVPQSGGLVLPYAGSALNINVDNSPDGKSWSNDFGGFDSVWGAGGAVLPYNHMWITYVDWSTTEIVIQQYN